MQWNRKEKKEWFHWPTKNPKEQREWSLLQIFFLHREVLSLLLEWGFAPPLYQQLFWLGLDISKRPLFSLTHGVTSPQVINPILVKSLVNMNLKHSFLSKCNSLINPLPLTIPLFLLINLIDLLNLTNYFVFPPFV
jgi:hypothetical protein